MASSQSGVSELQTPLKVLKVLKVAGSDEAKEEKEQDKTPVATDNEDQTAVATQVTSGKMCPAPEGSSREAKEEKEDKTPVATDNDKPAVATRVSGASEAAKSPGSHGP